MHIQCPLLAPRAPAPTPEALVLHIRFPAVDRLPELLTCGRFTPLHQPLRRVCCTFNNSLQWTASPEEALEVSIWLNDKCEFSVGKSWAPRACSKPGTAAPELLSRQCVGHARAALHGTRLDRPMKHGACPQHSNQSFIPFHSIHLFIPLIRHCRPAGWAGPQWLRGLHVVHRRHPRPGGRCAVTF